MYSKYVEVQPERAIRNNFAGKFKLKWNLGPGCGFVPAKSFLKFKIKITKGDGSLLSLVDGVGPNFLVCDQLFQQVYMCINNVCVGKIDAYVPQVSALRHRIGISSNRKESLISSVNYSNIYLEDRINEIVDDGRRFRKSELVISPESLGLAIPGTTYALANTGVMTLAGGGVDLTQALVEGDIIRFQHGANNATAHGTAIEIGAAVITLDFGTPNDIVAFGARNMTNLNWAVVRKVIPTRQDAAVELVWKPPLGFFDLKNTLPGNGDYMLDLTAYPIEEMQKFAVETLAPKDAGDQDVNIRVEVQEVLLYLYAEYNFKNADGKSYVYEDVSCCSQNITTTALNAKEFQVHEKNYKLTLAFQDSAVGYDTTKSKSKFKIEDDAEQNLLRYYITKDGVTLPDPIPSLNNDATFDITQKYYENYGYNNTIEMEKVETLREFLDAGLYFSHKFQNGPVKTNGVQVYTQFSSLPDGNLGQILLFDHYLQNLNLAMANGKISQVILS